MKVLEFVEKLHSLTLLHTNILSIQTLSCLIVSKRKLTKYYKKANTKTSIKSKVTNFKQYLQYLFTVEITQYIIWKKKKKTFHLNSTNYSCGLKVCITEKLRKLFFSSITFLVFCAVPIFLANLVCKSQKRLSNYRTESTSANPTSHITYISFKITASPF